MNHILQKEKIIQGICSFPLPIETGRIQSPRMVRPQAICKCHSLQEFVNPLVFNSLPEVLLTHNQPSCVLIKHPENTGLSLLMIWSEVSRTSDSFSESRGKNKIPHSACQKQKRAILCFTFMLSEDLLIVPGLRNILLASARAFSTLTLAWWNAPLVEI